MGHWTFFLAILVQSQVDTRCRVRVKREKERNWEIKATRMGVKGKDQRGQPLDEDGSGITECTAFDALRKCILAEIGQIL
jgi:hypothetical protein